ncbi:hypothetical protein QL285_000295 [Trifolium repens]|nr:hypothetical protein QL285_000295 [Trifolium repens]
MVRILINPWIKIVWLRLKSHTCAFSSVLFHLFSLPFHLLPLQPTTTASVFFVPFLSATRIHQRPVMSVCCTGHNPYAFLFVLLFLCSFFCLCVRLMLVCGACCHKSH